MNIPKEVLSSFGIEDNGPTSTELDMFSTMPLPFINTIPDASIYNVNINAVKYRFDIINDVYKNINSYKCNENALFKFEAYDNVSIRLGRFLLDNLSKVCMFTNAEVEYGLFMYFKYDSNLHELRLCLNPEADLSRLDYLSDTDRTALSTIIKCINEDDVTNEMLDDFERLIVDLFAGSLFIPLVNAGQKIVPAAHRSYSFSDIRKDKGIMVKLADFIGKCDIRPSIYKFYVIHWSSKYGWYLSADTRKKNISSVADIGIPEESVMWKDIKYNFGIRCGLSRYIDEADYYPQEDIYYFVRVSKDTNELWLKRDLEKSPKGNARKNKNKAD